jgi:hypothetical protein
MRLKATALFVILPLLMGAEIYRWVDRDGVINYTEREPIGIKSERIRVREGGPTQSIPVSAPPPVENEQPALSESQREMLDDLRDAEDAREAELARIKDANCERSRQVLDNLSSRGRVRIRDDETGEETMMPEEERQRRIKEAQDGIVANCDSAS